jgi:AraC family transcriptional regulator
MIRLEHFRYLGRNRRDFVMKGAILSETVYSGPVTEEWHYHEHEHLSLIIDGGNREEREGKEIIAKPGTLIRYPAGIVHRNRNTKFPSRNFNLSFTETFLTKVDGFTLTEDDHDLSFAVLKIYRECQTNELHTDGIINDMLLSCYVDNSRTKSSCSDQMKIVREVLHDRWSEVVSLDELSKASKLHPVTVSKWFPKYYRCTVGEYSRKLKVANAMMKIRESREHLTRIGLACGFFDQSHFIRAFKSVTGLNPKQWRNL